MACMVIEMALHQRDINIAGFAQRLAVIQCLKHRKQARVFLHRPRQRIKIARPPVPAQTRPAPLRAPGCGNGGINLGLARVA